MVQNEYTDPSLQVYTFTRFKQRLDVKNLCSNFRSHFESQLLSLLTNRLANGASRSRNWNFFVNIYIFIPFPNFLTLL